MNLKTPDSNGFSTAFGFDVPLSFQTFIRIVHRAAEGDREVFLRIVEDLFFFRPSTELLHSLGSDENRECRYPQTPLELVPFGDHGIDGAHIGFVIATPEIPADEFPICVFNPMDFEGVALSGITFPAAMERRIGELLSDKGRRFDDSARQLVQSLEDELQLSIEDVTNDMGWSSQQPLSLAVPTEYTQLPTSDGIGVLARKKHISKKRLARDLKLEPALAAAREFLAEGLLGNALYTLREAAWKNNGDAPTRRTIAHAMVDVYEKLGRSVLAKLARRRAQGEF